MPAGEFAMMTIPDPGKLTVEVSIPIGLISQTAPTAQPASAAPVSFLKVSSGLANVRVRLVNVPAGTVAVLRNADSVSSCFTSIWIGPLPPSRSTPPGLSVAPVTLTSNDSSVTPVGGVSVIVTDTAAAAAPDVTVIVAVAALIVSLTEVAASVTVAGFGTAAGAL